MTDYTKLTKAQLIAVIQEKDGIIEEIEDNKFNNFKEAFGLPFHTDEEWINFFKELQESSLKLDDYKKDIRKRELNKCI